MAQTHVFICSAANTEVPAYLVLSQKAYKITVFGADGWYAEKDGLCFQAESLIELLGLVCMYEARGPNWPAADQDINDFLSEYDR